MANSEVNDKSDKSGSLQLVNGTEFLRPKFLLNSLYAAVIFQPFTLSEAHKSMASQNTLKQTHV